MRTGTAIAHCVATQIADDGLRRSRRRDTTLTIAVSAAALLVAKLLVETLVGGSVAGFSGAVIAVAAVSGAVALNAAKCRIAELDRGRASAVVRHV